MEGFERSYRWSLSVPGPDMLTWFLSGGCNAPDCGCGHSRAVVVHHL